MSLNPMLLRLLMISPLLLTAACGGAPEDKKEEPLRVTVVRAAPADMAQTLRLSGTLSAREDIAVSTPLQGLKIVAVYADAGDTVKRGQVLAQLEDVNADSQLRQTEAQLARAKAQLRSQQVAAAEAAATLKRYRPLAEADALSRQELDQQKSAAATAAANVEAAKADIAQLQAQLKDSRNQRGKTQIVAPADGVIAKRNAEAGALTGPDALFHIIKDGTVELAADAGADELPLLQNGARAQVSVRGRNEAVGGTVRLVPPEIDSSTRLGKVRITLAHSDGLYTGTYGEANIRLPSYRAAAALPETAVSFDSEGKASVLAVDGNGRVSRVAVTAGRKQGGMVEIVSGLENGRAVVRRASAFVNEGDNVKAVEEKGK
ncbi:efflux RND transporter periplasmic adaptor subunit [Neisseria sp. oral taxon 014]|uniref:efflux RND transporter periplasmic adaptor subunit n=2 Tax=Neisseria sp. oral taxon 014 TaxID=641148 RepID=UPI00110BD9F8|nr:efflux RND transporter periplasmic adaptor subunit [Neisseria sp. oral taxon 014]